MLKGLLLGALLLGAPSYAQAAPNDSTTCRQAAQIIRGKSQPAKDELATYTGVKIAYFNMAYKTQHPDFQGLSKDKFMGVIANALVECISKPAIPFSDALLGQYAMGVMEP